MDNVFKNYGFQHIAESILFNLDHEDLLKCERVDVIRKNYLKYPTFWLKKCVQEGLPKESQNDIMKVIKKFPSSECQKILRNILKRIHKMAISYEINLELIKDQIDGDFTTIIMIKNDVLCMKEYIWTKILKGLPTNPHPLQLRRSLQKVHDPIHI